MVDDSRKAFLTLKLQKKQSPIIPREKTRMSLQVNYQKKKSKKRSVFLNQAPSVLIFRKRLSKQKRDQSFSSFQDRSAPGCFFFSRLLVYQSQLLILQSLSPMCLKCLAYLRLRVYEIAELSKANFDGLARNFWLRYAQTISVVSKLMQDFKVHISGPLHYCNLTTLSEDIDVDGYLMFDRSHKGKGRKSKHNVLGSMRETKVDSEPPEEEGQPKPAVDENIVEASGQHDWYYEGEVRQETEEVSEEHSTYRI